MHELRAEDRQTDRMRFRRNMERIGEVAAYEISKQLAYEEKIAQTSLGEAASRILKDQPVLATILRAGLPLHQGLLNYFDGAECAFIAAYRKHHRDGTFEIAQNYLTCPPLAAKVLILSDPMLATGASLSLALRGLEEHGPAKKIFVVTVIACNQGIENLLRKFPEISIFAGDIDDELTAKGYIVPGLGDAGDLAFGSKKQY
jgi:uracil phosphoribosyltransferase